MNILEYETTQELKSHGRDEFPFNIYPCSIPADFVLVPTHWHNDMEIIYIKKGCGKVVVELEPFLVQEGDILVIPPGQLHSIEQQEDFSMEYENIIFHLKMLMAAPGDCCTGKYFQPLLTGQLWLPCRYAPDHCAYPVLAQCLDTIDEICKRFAPGYQLAIKGQLFTFFYGLMSGQEDFVPRGQKKSLDRLKDILKYVETNYGESITVGDAAGICGFSKSHFMKFFKQNMAVSFVDYLNDYRLTMAARMLASSGDSVVSIAQETGFENLSYFNRMFKRRFGCTPTGFRRQL